MHPPSSHHSWRAYSLIETSIYFSYVRTPQCAPLCLWRFSCSTHAACMHAINCFLRMQLHDMHASVYGNCSSQWASNRRKPPTPPLPLSKPRPTNQPINQALPSSYFTPLFLPLSIPPSLPSFPPSPLIPPLFLPLLINNDPPNQYDPPCLLACWPALSVTQTDNHSTPACLPASHAL